MIGTVIFLAMLAIAQPVAAPCAMPPMPPPIGCRVGPCLCDANGKNCAWQFVCGPAEESSPKPQGADPDDVGERTLDCADLPRAVRAAFQKWFPHATMNGCDTEEELGKSVYEVTSTENGVRRDALFEADGAILVIEETIRPTDLPEAVRKAWNESFSDHSIVLVEKVIRGEKVTYEIQATHSGQPVEAAFDSDGKGLTTLSPGTR